MRTSSKFWGFSTKFDKSLDKNCKKFNIYNIMNNTAIKSHSNTENQYLSSFNYDGYYCGG